MRSIEKLVKILKMKMFVDKTSVNNTERQVEQLSGISQISSGAMSERYGIRSII